MVETTVVANDVEVIFKAAQLIRMRLWVATTAHSVGAMTYTQPTNFDYFRG